MVPISLEGPNSMSLGIAQNPISWYVYKYICDIPWYKVFPRSPFIINISMYFGATEKWHVQMVMVSRVVQLAEASDAPSGTRVPNRPAYAVILMITDV